MFEEDMIEKMEKVLCLPPYRFTFYFGLVLDLSGILPLFKIKFYLQGFLNYN
jgi:hypothetical protein